VVDRVEAVVAEDGQREPVGSKFGEVAHVTEAHIGIGVVAPARRNHGGRVVDADVVVAHEP